MPIPQEACDRTKGRARCSSHKNAIEPKDGQDAHPTRGFTIESTEGF
ncbi:hypothetical protein [Egbenema bharatensis]